MARLSSLDSFIELTPYRYESGDEPWLLARLRLGAPGVDVDRCGAFLQDCEIRALSDQLMSLAHTSVTSYRLQALEPFFGFGIHQVKRNDYWAVQCSYSDDYDKAGRANVELTVPTSALVDFGRALADDLHRIIAPSCS
ncbi:MAG: hypothetical protein IPM64_15035 [Phycisphaerales bacterium]|nr:hypothetical protein [Phycisphaerales bacterium]